MSVRVKTERYVAHLSWTGSRGAGTASYTEYDRSYRVRIDGKPAIEGSASPTFRGDPRVHNPEDLFLAAIASCHMLAYLALCANSGVRVLAYEDEAVGILALGSGREGRFREVALSPVVTLAAGADEAKALRLHEAAHERCFIANSCSVPIVVRPRIEVERLQHGP